MVAKALRNSISDKNIERLSVHKDRTGSRVTRYDYSDGSEITTEKTGDGIPGKMREVRTITNIKTPPARFTTPWRDQDHYDQVFRKGKYASE